MTANEITYITHYTHNVTVQPGSVAQITARPQLKAWRPVRLYIEPTLAPSFVICDVRIGMRSQFVNCQEIPASQFMHGRGTDLDELGDDFSAESMLVGMDFVMIVQNIGERDLPFRATWKCERDLKAEQAYKPIGDPQWDDMMRRRRDMAGAPSEIGHLPVARVVGRWEREVSVGWDPNGEY